MVEYIDKNDLQPELLLELWNNLDYDTDYLSQFVQLEKYEQGPIYIRYPLIKHKEADIVAYEGGPITKSGVSYEETSIQPFHIKNTREYKETDPYQQLISSGDGFKISAEALAEGMQDLENNRRALMWRSVASMALSKTFTYQNGDNYFSIPYDSMIGDLTPYTSGDFIREFEKAKHYFKEESGAPVSTVLISMNTADKIRGKTEVIKYLQTTLTHNNTEDLVFRIQNVPFIVETRKSDLFTIPDDVCVLISKEKNSKQPILINRVKNALNKFNADAPFFKSYKVAESPLTAYLEIYDNFIPTPSRKNAIMHWKI